MRALTLLFSTLALTSCRLPTSNLTPFQLDAVRTTALAWAGHGLPPLPKGACNASATQIRMAQDAAELLSICHAMGAACSRELGSKRNPYLEIVLYPGQTVDPMGEPIVHEVLHYLMWCAGLNRDYEHTDARVWAAPGGAGSVQYAADSMMTAPKTAW